MLERIKKIIKQGESNKVEFKEATFEIPRSIYETVCAFLNANGGEILLGVKDNEIIEGVAKDSVNNLKRIFNNN
jgi:ATP-dependent DNA helicase RecG